MAASDRAELVGARRRPARLPAEVTGFVGRSSELARIAALLTSARLVTILGPGGVGKTRVALRAAARAAGGYADGVCLAELSGLRDPALLADTVATALGLPPTDGHAQTRAVTDHLRDRRLLLILDTCEHIVQACAEFAGAVLNTAPGVRILATSRQPLETPGEHTFLLAPLPVRREDAAGDEGGGDAVELFAQRAAAATAGFTVTAANRADVVRLCRRLDGIPLAIELAAVRLRALSLRELADRLDERFEELTGGRRGGVGRHQTLRAAIGWSYDLCTDAERRLWQRLAVFAGSFDLAAVDDVCADDACAPDELLGTFMSLVDKSVVTRDGGRYRLLDTIREYGAVRLEASGDGQRFRRRHLARYLAMGRYFGDHFLDDDQTERYRALDAEHGNLRAAMEYGLESDDGRLIADGAALATALYGYWHVSGRLREGRLWLTRALAVLGAGPSPERAWALIVRGYLGTFGADLAQAVRDTREGTAMARELAAREGGGDGLLLARACLYQHMVLMLAGQRAEAFAAAREAGRRLESLGDRIGLLCHDAQMGYLLMTAGRLEEAIEACERGKRRLGDSRERWVSSYYFLLSGCAMFFQGGREAECAASVNAALEAKHELGDIVGQGYALEILAWLAAGEGRAGRAAWLLGGADVLWERAGGRLGGSAIMEETHKRTAQRVLAELGTGTFDRLFTRGRGHDPHLLVRAALSGADELREGGPAGPDPGTALTGREREIVGLISGGLSNREIGERLFISKRTVDSHVEHIYAKLGVTSRVQLAVRLEDNG